MISVAELAIIQKTELPEATISLRSDGIVHVHYHKNATLDVELQQSMRLIFIAMTGGKKTKFLFSADEGFSLTSEARKQAPALYRQSPISCYAIVAHNLAYKLVANFYIRVFKPSGNFKVFSDLKEAETWLTAQESND